MLVYRDGERIKTIQDVANINSNEGVITFFDDQGHTLFMTTNDAVLYIDRISFG